MSSAETETKKPLPWVKLSAVGVVVLVAAVAVWRGVDVPALVERGLDAIRRAGPVAFFAGMALLPAIGAPILAFSLTAGPAFAERIGTGWVVVLALVAVTVNFTLTYFLARRALRPLLERIVVRLGYQLPQVAERDATDLTILLRVTPGIPLCVQNYLLGLADVPFGRYFVVSAIVSWVYQTAFVLFGEAVLHGRGKVAMLASSLLIAAVAATHLVRKHYGKKRAESA